VIEQLLLALAEHLKAAGGLDLKECFVDGTFVPAKKGGAWLGKPSGARAPRSWALQTAMVFLSPCAQKVLRILADVPERLIGDKAYDSDRLDEQLMQEYGTELIAPNKQNRRVPTQDGRPLRRFVRRWKIERLFAWLFNFRRLVVRYEYHAENFQGFVHLAAAVILLRHL
jgi:transposase